MHNTHITHNMNWKPNVKITKVDNSFIKISTEEQGILSDINQKYTFMPEGVEFNPKFKYSKWDGKIRLFNKSKNTLPIGLFMDLLTWLESTNVNVDFNNELIPDPIVLEKDLDHEIEALDLPFELYDYQLSAVSHIMNLQRCTLLAATSAGKSLIIYTGTRLLERKGKTMIIVPSISLCEQLYQDFIDYSSENNFNVHDKVQRVSGNYTKELYADVVITTWQSAQSFTSQALSEFSSVIVDECHNAKAKVLTKIVQGCVNAEVKVGLTGTLDGVEVNEMTIEGLFGPVVRVVSAKELIESGAASEIEIIMVQLKHTLQDDLPHDYRTQIQFLEDSQERTDFIGALVQSLDGNTLVLHSGVQHGKDISSVIEGSHIINGSVKSDDREEIKKEIKAHHGETLVATYQTCSTGISINNLHNLILAAPTKSVVRTLQSIGRSMRKHESKEKAMIFDIVDNLGDDSYPMRHAERRLEMYIDQGFPVSEMEFVI